jgi:predicted alpha/beta-hydrolase family hydrolase
VTSARPPARGTTIIAVQTPQGPGRFFIDQAPETTAMLILGHGAGGGVTATDLELLARRLPEGGITVVRFEQPWRTAGRKIAGRPPTLDAAWLAAVGWLGIELAAGVPLYLGGRSAGARVACRTATALGAAGVVCLAFPLHLPGRPEKSRVEELLAPTVGRLVLQGTSDSFGRPDEIRAATGEAPGIELVELPGADHSFRLPKASPFTPADLRATLVDRITRFVAAPTH